MVDMAAEASALTPDTRVNPRLKVFFASAAIYAMALALRLFLIHWPPTGFFYNIDELEMTLTCVDRFLGLPPTSLQWPGSTLQLLFLPVAGIDLLLHAVFSTPSGSLITRVAGAISNIYANPEHEVTLLRYMVAALSSIGPVLAFWMALKLTGLRSSAWICAAIAGLTPVFVEQSAMAMGDAPAIAFGLAAIFLAICCGTRYAFLAGFLFAAGLGCRVTIAGLLLVPFLLFLSEAETGRQRVRAAALLASGLVTGFLFWCPFVWTDPVRFAKALGGHLHEKSGLHLDAFVTNWLSSMGISLTVGLLVSLVGCIFFTSARRLKRTAIVAGLSLLVIAAPLVTARDIFPRYFLPALPCILLLVAIGASVPLMSRGARTARNVLLGLALLLMTVEITRAELSLRPHDDFSDALNLVKTFPPGTNIYLPEEAIDSFRIPLDRDVYARMIKHASSSLDDHSGLFQFLRMRGIPESAGEVLLTDLNEDEQARKARLIAASATAGPARYHLYFYFEPASINGIVEERLTSADYTLHAAMDRMRTQPGAAILIRGNSAAPGTPIWNGVQAWHWYR